MKLKIVEKLKENHGASMLLALALFLVCFMVSSVVVMTAASGGSRNLLRVQRQQDYLAVSSAAQLIAEDLSNLQDQKFVGSFMRRIYGCQDFQKQVTKEYFGENITGYEYQEGVIPNALDAIIIDSHHDNEQTMDVDRDLTNVDGVFRELIIRAAEKVYEKGMYYEESFTICLTDPEEKRLPEVICNFTMDVNYDMEFEVITDNSAYGIVIQIACTNLQENLIEESDFHCKHMVLYKEKQADGSYKDAEKEEIIPGNSQIIQTVVTWGAPNITKGVGLE